MQTRRQLLRAKAHQPPLEAAHIVRKTSSYHGDRGAVSVFNGGQLPKGRGVSHAFKSKSSSSRRTQVYKQVLLREISKTAPAGKDHTKVREREKVKLQKIATLKKIEPSMAHSISREFLKADSNKVVFSNSTGTATATAEGKGVFTHLLHTTMAIVNDKEGTGCQMVDSDGNIVFLLYPRKVVQDDTGNKAYGDVRALDRLQKKKSTTKR